MSDSWDQKEEPRIKQRSRKKPVIAGVLAAIIVTVGTLYYLQVIPSITTIQPSIEGLIGDITGVGGSSGTNESVGVGDSVDVEVKRGRNPDQLGITGQFVNYYGHVVIEAFHPDGTKFYHHEDHNLLLNEGKEFIEDQVLATSGIGSNGANYIALSNGGTAPAAGDTSCETEITANGLQRAQGTVTDTGTGTNTVSKTFTATGAQSAQKSCLFTDGTSGEPDTMLAENTFTQVTLATNDQLSITWTITIS